MTIPQDVRDDAVVGLIPAAGQAERLAPLPCSKELYPIGFHSVDKDQSRRPKVICHYLLEKMRLAGITKAYMVLRPGKWDIPAYFGDGSLVNMHLAYLTIGLSFGVPFTLDQAYPFVRHATIAFGFPDILFDPEDAFVRLLARQSASQADVALGLFPGNHPSKEDVVDFTDTGEVRDLILRPSDSSLRYTWGIAVWTPNFTQFLHDYVTEKKGLRENTELSAGHAIKAAIQTGLRVQGLVLNEEPYLDIGTPEDLLKAVNKSAKG